MKKQKNLTVTYFVNFGDDILSQGPSDIHFVCMRVDMRVCLFACVCVRMRACVRVRVRFVCVCMRVCGFLQGTEKKKMT